MLAATSTQFVFGTAVVAACEILSRILTVNWSYLRVQLKGTPHLLFRFVDRIAADQATITSFYTTIGSIEGTLLGLYFASVSIVVSTTYATVPGEVRDLLLKEKAGNKYVRTIALCASMAILLVALHGVGHKSGVLTLGVVAGIAIVSIFSLIELGTRIFHFFDPAYLVDYVVQDLANVIRLATTTGFAWDDPSFQDHYRQQAERHLKTYRHITRMAAEEHYHAVGALADKINALLTYYVEEKLRIPTTSRWFKRVYRHKKWLMTDYSQVSFALQTGTVLHPEEVPDHNWIESDASAVLVHITEAQLEKDDISGAAQTSYAIAQTLENISARWAVGEALQVYGKIRPTLTTYLFGERNSAPVASEDIEEQLQDNLALADALGMTLVGISLGLAKNLREIAGDSFGRVIADIDWDKQSGIYSAKMPRAVVAELELLRNKVILEARIEGRRISPTWYLQQIAALGFARYVSDATEKLMKEMEDLFPATAEKLIGEKKYLIAAQLVQRGMEAHNKLTTQLNETNACVERLVAFRKVPDIPWPVPDLEAHAARAKAMYERLIVVWGKLALPLSGVAPTERRIDYFGQAYTILAHECYVAMWNGNEGLFQKIFPSFFAAGILAYERLYKETAGQKQEVVIALNTEPYMDLLELSGYSIIYSELDSKSFWSVAKDVWDRYISAHPNKGAFIDFLSAVHDFRSSLHASTPREAERFSWKSNLDHRLRKKGVHYDIEDERHGEVDAARHPSPIVRAIVTEGRFVEGQALQVFLVAYLMKHPDAAGHTFPRRTQEFSRLVEKMKSAGTKE